MLKTKQGMIGHS